MKQVLLFPMGSSGDVHPFIGLGRVLRERGHQVTLFACEEFETTARQSGLEFESVLSAEDYHNIQRDPEIWHPTRGPRTVFRRTQTLESYRLFLKLVNERHIPGKTVLVGGSLAIGPRIIRDHLKIPFTTIHLQPSVIISPVRPAKLASGSIPRWWPYWLRKLAYWGAERVFLDPILRPTVNTFRAEIGLPAIRRVFSKYVHSPDLVIGLFPEWYAERVADWPQNMQLTSFPLYDEANIRPLTAEQQAFLASGPPPVVVTFGTAMRHAKPYFTAIATALHQINQRGILLTPYAEQIPEQLPPNVIHVNYIPLSLLLPHSAVMVHHGGIGTASQAMKAGTPQLIMPMTHDQPDNAERLERLGIAQTIWPTKFTANNIAKVLNDLITNQHYKVAAKQIAEKLRQENGLLSAAKLIEQLPATLTSAVT